MREKVAQAVAELHKQFPGFTFILMFKQDGSGQIEMASNLQSQTEATHMVKEIGVHLHLMEQQAAPVYKPSWMKKI